jgi:hypothetical protein
MKKKKAVRMVEAVLEEETLALELKQRLVPVPALAFAQVSVLAPMLVFV